MGITDSKMLALRVLTACEEAEMQGKSRVDDASFWRDEVVFNAARKVFQQVPRHIRGSCRQNAAERAAAKSNSKIHVPEVVKYIQNKQRKALVQNGSPQEGDSSSPHCAFLSDQSMKNCSLAGCYMLVNDIERDKEFSTVRLRLFYVLFFRLKQSMQPKRLCADVISLLVQIIYHSGLVKDSRDVVEKKLVTWTDRGERYELLAKDCGGLGSLFVLPDDIPESVWAKDLPKTAGHKKRLAVINSMKRRGIANAAADLNSAAEIELETLWKPIRISVDMEIDREFSRMRNPNDERFTAQSGTHQPNASTSSHTRHEQPGPPTPCQNSADENERPYNLEALVSGVTHNSENCPSYSGTMASHNLSAKPAEVLNDALPISKDAVHDLASFSMPSNPASEDVYASVPNNICHDLASFSMLPNLSSEEVVPSLPNNDLISFSTLPTSASEDVFASVPSNVYHDLAAFSMFRNLPFDDASSAVPSTAHHNSDPFSMHLNCTTGGAILSSDTNVVPVSDHSRLAGTHGQALSSISIPGLSENDHNTPVLSHA